MVHSNKWILRSFGFIDFLKGLSYYLANFPRKLHENEKKLWSLNDILGLELELHIIAIRAGFKVWI